MESLFRAIDVASVTSQDIIDAAATTLAFTLAPDRRNSPSLSSSSSNSTSSNISQPQNTITSTSPLLSTLLPPPLSLPDGTTQTAISSPLSSDSSSSSSSSSPLASWASRLRTAASSEEKSELRFRGMTKEEIDQMLWDHRTVFTAGTASLISTAASFPFDSLKSRLQVKYYPSIWDCAKAVFREEGMGGFFRGVFVPLLTISFVRTSSFSIYVNTKQALHSRDKFNDKTKLAHTALSGMAGGATSGVIISCGSAPFELVKVQRQLEYLTAVQRGLISAGSENQAPNATGSNAGKSVSSRPSPQPKFQARSGFAAAADIFKNHGGLKGFYIGFPMHLTRDTLGTALYFGSYDSIRSIVNKHTNPNNGSLYGVPGPVVSFLSGSTAGILSWLIVYPVDLVKTNVQQRTLSSHPRQLTGYQLFLHLLRERPPPENAKKDTNIKRFLRLYRGLGVSALRSFISHGLTWSIIEALSDRISKRTGKEVRSTG